jgi:hypothetical protein
MPTQADTSGMAQFGMGMQVAGAVSSAIGAYASVKSTKANLRMQAILNGINAQSAERTADSTLAAGQHEEQASMLRTAQLKSTQQAQFAASGIDLGEGSAARVLTSTDVMGAIDKNTIAANAVRSAWGYRTGAVSASNQGLMESASAASMSTGIAGGTSLLGSAGQVAQNWYMLNKQGAFTPPPNATGAGMTIDAGTQVNPNLG